MLQSLRTAYRLMLLAQGAILSTALCAQMPSLNWAQNYYTGQGTNVGQRVIVAPDTAVYVLGGDGFNTYVKRYRSFDGQSQWQQQWDSATAAVDLVRGANGMLVAAWTFYNEPFNSPLDIGVSAFASDGTPMWTYFYNDSLDRDDIVRDLHVDVNGDILLCATTEELSGNPSVFNNITTIKLDANGNLLWRRTWNGTINNDDEPSAISSDAQGNVFVAGYTTSAGLAAQDLLLLNYNGAGVLQWSRVVNRNSGFGSHVDKATHVVTDALGNAYVAGLTESPSSTNGEDISVYKYAPSGTLLWQCHYDNKNEESVVDLDIDASGRTYLLGRFSSNGGNGEAMVRVKANGTLDWAGLYANGSLDVPFPAALARSPDGTVITTGMVGDQLLRDAYVRAYDSTGTVLWTYRYTATNSFNEEEGHDIAIGTNRAIYVTGMYDQSGQSLIRGVTFCLCPEVDGVCLLTPTAEPVFPTNDIVGTDLDQDGWRDLVFTFPQQNIISVYTGSSSGFNLAPSIPVPAQRTLLAAGDLDQDGDEDIVTGELGTADLFVVMNNGGTLAYANTVATGQPVLDLKVADLDGQNGKDIVAVMNASPFVIVLLNNGNGTFTASYPTPVANPYRVDVGDADGDGVNDLLIGRVVQDMIYLLHGNGNGTFGAPSGFDSGSVGPAIVGIGDFTFDGINDLVTCNGTSTWSVRPGTGGGAFAPAISGYLGAVNEFVISPFAQDTSFRLLTGNYASTGRLTYSSCSYGYTNVSLATTAAGNHCVDVADWTNDGSPDILSFYTGGELRLWRNCDTSGVFTETPEVLQVRTGQVLTVFPSPTAAQATVLRPAEARGIAEISLWTLRGERVQRWTSAAPMQELDLSERAEGVYLVRYSTAQATWTTRLVLMRGE